MRAALAIGCSLVALAVAGCGNSATAGSGAAEPLRVTGGQFFEGAFPAPNGGPAIEVPDSVRTSIVPAGFTGKKSAG